MPDPTPAAPDPAALVAAALARHAASTSGRWYAKMHSVRHEDGRRLASVEQPADAVFMAAAHNTDVPALAAALTTARAHAAAADALIRALVVTGHHAPWCDYIGASTAPYLPCNCEWDAATTAAQAWLTARAGAGEGTTTPANTTDGSHKGE